MFSPTVQIILWLLAAGLVSALWILVRKQQRMLAEQQRANEKLALQGLNLARMQQAIESASDAIGIVDMSGHSLYHNRAHVQLFGYSVDELNAVPGSGVLFADPVVAAEIHLAIQNQHSWSGETDVRTKDGRWVPVFVRASLIRDERGAPAGIFGVFTDITERRQASQKLREQQQRLQITLQGITDAVITLDHAGNIVLMNPAAEALVGYSLAVAGGLELGEVMRLLDEHSRAPRENPARALLRAGPDASHAVTVYRLVHHQGGPERIIAEHATLIRNRRGEVSGAVLALRDITRERQAAEESARASKLESLGLLAGGIAHDFGNLLATMVAHISLAQFERGVPPAVLGRLTELERVVWRARDITQQLLTFARGDAPRKQAVALPSLIREAVQFAINRHPVESITAFTPDLWPVEADEGQLLQVINNLAINAVQAMPKGGKLTVMASNLPVTAAPDETRRVEIIVSDTGSGIAPEHLSRLFDPFFTTKKNGTGLGLATSYSIVTKHGGQMRVESTVGRGTTFFITLPAAATAASSGGSGANGGRSARLGRVLVLDDERAVRESVALMLSMLHYDAIEAENGRQAIELFEQARQTSRPFKAAILDLRLPDGPGGAETLKRLLELDPGLRAVATSAYPDDPVMMEFPSYGFAAKLDKPIAMSDLKTLLATLIKEPKP